MEGPVCSFGRSGGLLITIAAPVPHWPLELLYFVFAKESEVLFHPGFFTLVGCTFSVVSAAYIKIVNLREASFMDSLYLMLHRTCTMHSTSFNSGILESTPITWEIEKSSKLSLSFALRLWLLPCISHYSLVLTCWLIHFMMHRHSICMRKTCQSLGGFFFPPLNWLSSKSWPISIFNGFFVQQDLSICQGIKDAFKPAYFHSWGISLKIMLV